VVHTYSILWVLGAPSLAEWRPEREVYLHLEPKARMLEELLLRFLYIFMVRHGRFHIPAFGYTYVSGKYGVNFITRGSV
jgi:hypothetical protein